MSARPLKILTTCFEHWSRGYAGDCGAVVEHVSVGGTDPKRLDGFSTGDGIGEVVTPVGVKQLMEIAKSFKPDVFLYGKHHNFTAGMVESVKFRCGCKTAMHYCDQRDGVHEEVGRYTGILDLLLVTNRDPDDHAKYVKAGTVGAVRTLLDGVDLEVYDAGRLREVESSHEVFFGGNNWHGLARELTARGQPVMPEIVFKGGPFRDQLLMAVDGEYDLGIRGSHGWGVHQWRNPVGNPVYHPGYAEVMADGDVILSSTNAPRYGLVTRRTLRSVATGRPFVTDYVSGMEKVFDDGVHLAWYMSVDEAVEKIDWCLNDPVYRRRLSIEGPKLIAKMHTFKHRLKDFVKICGEVF